MIPSNDKTSSFSHQELMETNTGRPYTAPIFRVEPNCLTFDSLCTANNKRRPQFKDKQGRIVHNNNPDGGWNLSQWSNATLGELGEAANIIKKIERGDFTDAEMPGIMEKLAYELADVQIYLDLLATAAGINLGYATVAKFNKVSNEQGIKVFL